MKDDLFLPTEYYRSQDVLANLPLELADAERSALAKRSSVVPDVLNRLSEAN